MRTHGWGGATPGSDEEAIERILDAAGAAIDERGANIRVAEVARALEISRQTVYNYFPGNSTLVEAVANRSGLKFIERLAAHASSLGGGVIWRAAPACVLSCMIPPLRRPAILRRCQLAGRSPAATSSG
jgi:AcrR family transcriptional regulator